MTVRVSLARAVGIATIAAIAGCAAPNPRSIAPNDATATATAVAVSWASTLIAAQSDVERGRYADADFSLREFADRAPGTPEAVETLYWRAVFMLDPASRTASVREAAGLLDGYLGSRVPLTRRSEAAVLQRLVAAIEATPPQVSAPTSEPQSLRDELGRAKTELEQAKVVHEQTKTELEATKAELERIRRRLAAPPPTSVPPTPPPPSPDAE